MLNKLARDITYEFFGNAIEVGKYFNYRGRPIKIISGQFLGTYGGLSNHWHWKEVLADGSLSERDEMGYGGKEDVFKSITRKEAMEIARGE